MGICFSGEEEGAAGPAETTNPDMKNTETDGMQVSKRIKGSIRYDDGQRGYRGQPAASYQGGFFGSLASSVPEDQAIRDPGIDDDKEVGDSSPGITVVQAPKALRYPSSMDPDPGDDRTGHRSSAFDSTESGDSAFSDGILQMELAYEREAASLAGIRSSGRNVEV